MFDSELKISFFLQIHNELWSERMVAERLEQLPKLGKRRQIFLGATDGAVSIVYLGKELLGVEFSDIIDRLHIRPNQLLAGEEQRIDLHYGGASIRLVPRGDELLYEGISTSPKRRWAIQTILPMNLFVREWTSMYFRFSRLMSWLGRSSMDPIIYGWEKYMSQKWRNIMGEGRMMKLCEADLDDLLRETDGPYGFVVSVEDGAIQITPMT